MINLPEVTLFSIDTRTEIDGTINALYTSMSGIEYGKVKLLTTKKNIEKYKLELESDGISLEEPVMEVNNYDDYNYFVVYKLVEHIDTSHCLLVQPDGFVLFPEKWQNSWLDYDYIGAPWPLSKDSYLDPWGKSHRVGNGGFSLRSKKLLQVPTKVNVPWEINNSDFYKMPEGVSNYHEDGNICVHNRHIYEQEGCKFAPVNVAVKFSQESKIPECEGVTPFGFHYFLPSGVTLES